MVGKIYVRIVSDRLKVLTNVLVMDEQGEFRAGRGCIDQVLPVRQVFEKAIKDKGVHAAFVDLKNTYDAVSRKKLWVALKDYGVSGKLLVAVQSLYEDGWVRVRGRGR